MSLPPRFGRFFSSGLLLLLGFAQPARADLRMIFDVTHVADTPATERPKKEATHTERKFPLTVELGEDYFSSTDDETASFADFAQKQTYRLDLRGKTYHVFSLYSDIGFRDIEFRNRLMMQKALAAGGIKNNPFDLVLMEHLFGLRAPEGVPLISTSKGESLLYSHEGKTLFSCGSEGTALNGTEAKSFIRFLRYMFAMHPDILAALEKRSVIPGEFDLHRNEIKSENFHFLLVKTEKIPRAFDPGKAIAGLKLAETELTPVCARADALSPQQFQEKCAELIQVAAKESDAGRPFDAFLLFLENTLSSGQPLPNDFLSRKSALQTDASVQAFLKVGNPRDKVSAQKAADVMHGLQSAAKKGVAVLKIREANFLTAAGKQEEARALFVDALGQSPWIAGAWKDLGDLYYGRFEAGKAWQCWETGRKLFPHHPQFKPVGEFENKLRFLYPEFF